VRTVRCAIRAFDNVFGTSDGMTGSCARFPVEMKYPTLSAGPPEPFRLIGATEPIGLAVVIIGKSAAAIRRIPDGVRGP